MDAAFAVLGLGALLALALLVAMAWLMVRLSWPHVEATGDPELGINFSCNQAEYLLLEDPALGEAGYVADSRPGRASWCAQVLGALLDDLGAKHVRISVEWSQVEPRPGEFDFTLVDALLAEAGRRGARAVVGIGIKAQRHPEFYIPEWVKDRVSIERGDVVSDDPYLRERALMMAASVVAHVAGSPVVEGWGAENEPYIPSGRAGHVTLSRGYVAELVRVIREADPLRRPVSINHAQHFVFDRRWQWALQDSDALAASIYPYRNVSAFGINGVVNILELGPLNTNYAHQAREAHRAGKLFWITEMQGEPWTDGDARLISPDEPSPNLSPARLRRSIDYSRRSGADRVYLWGAEWWLFQREEYGDARWLDVARGEFAQPALAADVARP